MKRAPRLTKEQRRDAGMIRTQRDEKGHENAKRDQRCIDYARAYAREVVQAFPASELFGLMLQETRAGRAAALEFERVASMLTTQAMQKGLFTYGALTRGEARVKTLMQEERELCHQKTKQNTLVWLEYQGQVFEPIISFAVDSEQRVGWGRFGGELAYDTETDLGDPTGQKLTHEEASALAEATGQRLPESTEVGIDLAAQGGDTTVITRQTLADADAAMPSQWEPKHGGKLELNEAFGKVAEPTGE